MNVNIPLGLLNDWNGRIRVGKDMDLYYLHGKKEPGRFSITTCEVKIDLWGGSIILTVFTPLPNIFLLETFPHMIYSKTLPPKTILISLAAISEYLFLLPPCKKFQDVHYPRISFV